MTLAHKAEAEELGSKQRTEVVWRMVKEKKSGEKVYELVWDGESTAGLLLLMAEWSKGEGRRSQKES